MHDQHRNIFILSDCQLTVRRFNSENFQNLSEQCVSVFWKLLSTVAHRCHGTNKNLKAQTKTSRHKQESHGTNKSFTTRTSRHKNVTAQKRHGTKTSRHKLKAHSTKQNFMAQEQDTLHSRCERHWSVYIDQCLQTIFMHNMADKFCTNCGTKILLEDKFCGRCGSGESILKFANRPHRT